MLLLWILYVNFVYSLSCCLVCSLQPCAHLLGKGWPFGSPVCDDFLCFFHFPIWCPGLGEVFDYINSWSLASSLLLLLLLCFLLSLSNEAGRLIAFAQFFLFIILLLPFLLFLSTKILSGWVSVTTGWIVLKFGDMVEMDVNLCKRVSKCQALQLAHRYAQNHWFSVQTISH